MSNEYKQKVLRAALSQFKEEFKVTQKGVLARIGSGSEQTVAKYINLIKADLSSQEIAVFSPELPRELIPVLEGIYHKSMEYAVASLSEERAMVHEENKSALMKASTLKIRVEALVTECHEKDLEIITIRNENEKLKIELGKLRKQCQIYDQQVTDLEGAIKRESERNVLARSLLRAEHKEVITNLRNDFNDRISSYKIDIAKVSNEKQEMAKQIDFERSRSEDETARLFREIDALKTSFKDEKMGYIDVCKRLESELDISHAREDRDVRVKDVMEKKIADLENKIKEKLSQLDENHSSQHEV